MTVRAAIGLGSNLGDRARHLAGAVDEIAARVGEIVATSSIYETAPVGGPDQGHYLNAVVVVDTELAPGTVLEHMLAIEGEHGRQRRQRWGPRTLDLDLLVYGGERVDEPGLTVPHPEMTHRRFVLEPLIEAWPDAPLPGDVEAGELLEAVADQDVRRWQGGGGIGTRAAAAMVFFTVGLAAVAIWWIIDALL